MAGWQLAAAAAAESTQQTSMGALGVAPRKTKRAIAHDCIANSRLAVVYAKVLLVLQQARKQHQMVDRLERVCLNLTVADIALVVVVVRWH